MNKNINAFLVIAGPDDGQLQEVRGLVKQHNLAKRVIITGLLSHQEVLGAFVDADLFVLPCRTDTFPMAMVEACLTDTPMVVTDRCEIANIVKDRIAEVVPFDAGQFAQTIESLLKKPNPIKKFTS